MAKVHDLKPTPFAVDVDTAVRMSGIGRTSLFAAMARGDLPRRKLGRKTVILVSDLLSWLEQLPITRPAVRQCETCQASAGGRRDLCGRGREREGAPDK